MRLFSILFLLCFIGYSQNGLLMPEHKKSYVISFQHLSNLIVLKIKLNDIPMNFILDSGVSTSVLFSLEAVDSVKLKNVETVSLKGLGQEEAVAAYLSKDNIIEIGKYKDENHPMYILLDDSINLSSKLGIPINGVIGYSFFQNYLVNINYVNHKIKLYNTNFFKEKRLKKYDKNALKFFADKPFLLTDLSINNQLKQGLMLLDTGNSDGFWHFDNTSINTENCINDYLGRGFSGDIYGSRCRFEQLQINDYFIKKPLVVKPDSLSLKNVILNKNRIGSLGGEYLKRFHVVFDYQNKQVYFKKNKNFKNKFDYNMSGITVIQNGKELLQTSVSGINNVLIAKDYNVAKAAAAFDFKYVPVFEILHVSEDSEAFKKGIRPNDKLISINGIKVYNLTIQKINDLLKTGDGKKLTLEVISNKRVLNTKIILKKII